MIFNEWMKKAEIIDRFKKGKIKKHCLLLYPVKESPKYFTLNKSKLDSNDILG